MKLLLPSSFLLGSILATASASEVTSSKPIIPNKSKNETEASSTASLVDPISPTPVATACAQGTGACDDCGVGETLLKVLINTDDYPEETSWTDSNGDGLEGLKVNGSYIVVYGDYEVSGGGDFGYVETKDLFTGAGSCCGVGETLLRVLINLDAYPEQTSWTVRNLCTSNDEVMSAGDYDEVDDEYKTFHYHQCVPNGEYFFTINDSNGDGLSFGHSYSVAYGDYEVSGGGDFGYVETKDLFTGTGSCCGVGETLLRVLINLDAFPDETSWTVQNLCTSNDEVMSAGDYDEVDDKYKTFHYLQCVPNGEYFFAIIDSHGDGLSGRGGGSYSVAYGDYEVSGGGDFGCVETKDLFTGTVSCCGVDETLLRVLITTDGYPEETNWTVQNLCTYDEVMSAGDYDEVDDKYKTFYYHQCVPNREYFFTINDSNEDGLDVDNCGDYTVKYGDYEVSYAGNEFKTDTKNLFIGAGTVKCGAKAAKRKKKQAKRANRLDAKIQESLMSSGGTSPLIGDAGKLALIAALSTFFVLYD